VSQFCNDNLIRIEYEKLIIPLTIIMIKSKYVLRSMNEHFLNPYFKVKQSLPKTFCINLNCVVAFSQIRLKKNQVVV
jgi:hypothetical protein